MVKIVAKRVSNLFALGEPSPTEKLTERCCECCQPGVGSLPGRVCAPRRGVGWAAANRDIRAGGFGGSILAPFEEHGDGVVALEGKAQGAAALRFEEISSTT